MCNDAGAPGWKTRQMAGPSSRRDRKTGPTFFSLRQMSVWGK